MNKILETIDFEIYKLNEKYKMDYAYSDPRTNETLVALTTLESLRGQLEPLVSQENGGRECPLCGGKNKKEFGGNDKCFHCENETCGFVQCEQSVDDVIYMVSKRIKKFYKG